MYDSFNKFIENYIIKYSQLKGALMLTGDWGTGKTHYINNQLNEYLNKNRNIDCIVISLYGLDNIGDISKLIYLELKIEQLKKLKELKHSKKRENLHKKKLNSEKKQIGKMFIKQLLNIASNKIGFSLDINSRDLEKLLKNMDLSKKLIILEDVERTNINVISLFGYINSLVNEDNIKILIVANEKEILTNNVNKDDYNLYYKVKEKTICDTLQFKSNVKNSLMEIVKNFDNEKLKNLFYENENLYEIIENEIMIEPNIKSKNLRSFIFACQKFIDIFQNFENDFNKEFKEKVFLGMVAFSLRKKSNSRLNWQENNKISSKLGTDSFPLYKFCYDYIENQFIDYNEIKIAYNSYMYEKESLNKSKKYNLHIGNIYNFQLSNEEELNQALNYLYEKLQNSNEIPLKEYITLLGHLIAIESVIDNPMVSKCITLISTTKKQIDIQDLDEMEYMQNFQYKEEHLQDKFNKLKLVIINNFKDSNVSSFEFNYDVNGIVNHCKYIKTKREFFKENKGFANKIEIEKFIDLLRKCNSKEIHEIIMVFQAIYGVQAQKEFFLNDLESLKKIKQLIIELQNENLDKIQLLQLSLLENNLEKYINQLENE